MKYEFIVLLWHVILILLLDNPLSVCKTDSDILRQLFTKLEMLYEKYCKFDNNY